MGGALASRRYSEAGLQRDCGPLRKVVAKDRLETEGLERQNYI